MAFDFPSTPSVGQSYQGYTWDGEKWVVAASGGKLNRFAYIATAGQTVFSGADLAGNTLSYLLGAIEVIVNGIHIPPEDYTAADGTSVTLDLALSVGDYVYIQAFSNFSVLDALQKTLNGSDIPAPATFRSNLGLGSYAIASLGQLPSSQNNTVPASGFIGQQLTTVTSTGLTSATPAQAGFIDVPAGVWDLDADNTFGGPGATSSSDWWTAISTVTASVVSGIISVAHNRRPAGADVSEHHCLPRRRVAVNATTRYYCNAQATFSVSTYNCNGTMTATRVN